MGGLDHLLPVQMLLQEHRQMLEVHYQNLRRLVLVSAVVLVLRVPEIVPKSAV
jgi:hypothetical protein